MIQNRNPRCDLLAVVLLVLNAFLVVALLTWDPADPVAPLFQPLDRLWQADMLVWPANEEVRNACGHTGALAASLLYSTLGIGAWVLAIGMAGVIVSLFHHQPTMSIWKRWTGWLLVLAGLTTLVNLLFPLWTPGPISGPGGYLGAMGAGLLHQHFAGTGSLLLASSVLLIGLFLWTEYALVQGVGAVAVGLASVFSFMLPRGSIGRLRQLFRMKRTGAGPGDDEEEADEDEDEEAEETEEEEQAVSTGRPSIVADLDEEELEDPGDEEYEEEEGEDWEEECEEDSSLIPFRVNTAASTTVAEPEAGTEVAGQDAPQTGDPQPVPKPAGRRKLFGRKNRPKDQTPENSPATGNSKSVDERREVMSRLDAAALREDAAEYDLPSRDLLKLSARIPDDQVRSQTLRRGKMLEQKFQEFGYKVRVVDIDTGPVITQYELELETGLRLSRIMGLSDDIAIGLRVPSVRIVAPIPGKNSVGIEVPNESRQMVSLRDVMDASTEQTRKMKIPLFLGQDVSGNTLVADLAKLPHLLIAGRTGTGKSVCLNAIITSMLMTRRPDEVRMLMIDPKMVELSGYSRLPHLMHPVVTDMKKAEAILAWAVEKMEERYRLMARAGVRHLNSYNQLGEEELMDRLKPADEEERAAIPLNMPFIVIVADEMADLMMTAGKEVESHIIRLAQKSRAVGIHLILATQKPTVDVVTGLIKSNLPARISFQVASQMDSRVVLDANGAEKLLGNGDMLFLGPGTSNLLRGQGTFLSDDEIDAITDSVSTGEQNFVNELVNMKVESEDDNENFSEKLKNRDALYHRAVETVITEDRGSVSLLQRCLGIGYGRAARLIDFMEEDGVVGPYNGSKSREIIMTMDQWLQFEAGEEGTAGEGPAAAPNRERAADIRVVEETEDEEEPVAFEQIEEDDTAGPRVNSRTGQGEDPEQDEWEEEEPAGLPAEDYGSADDDEEEEEYDEQEYEEEEEEEDGQAAADSEWEYEYVDEDDEDLDEDEADQDEDDQAEDDQDEDGEWEYEYVEEEA